MLAHAAVWLPHLHHELVDWCCIAGLFVVFATPVLVAAIRHRLWRRRVLSAFR